MISFSSSQILKFNWPQLVFFSISFHKIIANYTEKAPLFNKFGPVYADFVSGVADSRRR